MFYARFAPTPSGFLHAGNALNFILTWVYARHFNAKLGLRIDDLDPFRCEMEYVDYIFKALDWLGLSWDEPPYNQNEFCQKYLYKYRENSYREFLLHVKKSPWTYVCKCSRKELKTLGFKCTCKDKNLPLIPYQSALKADLKSLNKKVLFGIDISILEDPVLWRKEDIPSYHLASLCDALQLSLAFALNLENFTQSLFIHHPLIADFDEKKLSKSRHSPALDFANSPSWLYAKASNILGIEACYDAYSLLKSFGKNENSLVFGFNIGGEK
jgi:glutamyl-tRNA synthetase